MKQPDTSTIAQKAPQGRVELWLNGRLFRFKQGMSAYLTATLDDRLSPIEKQVQALKREIYLLNEENKRLKERVALSEQQRDKVDQALADSATAIALCKKLIHNLDLVTDFVLGSTAKVKHELQRTGARFSQLVRQAKALADLEGHSQSGLGLSEEVKRIIRD